ncbi:DUF885 domain-containing protein [Coralloluteibacterium stylophorae]|uniref:DUF885 family protein n=1 Tax=Coralloluteibacterium stylophorae TaxID=1776034 RepID=A0AAP2CAK1_9GAMM|nr:DUF885 family protein [Coralloluteibacterium stylophorae]
MRPSALPRPTDAHDVKSLLACGALALCLALPAPRAHASAADDAFEAVYEQEWDWRQAEFGRDDDEDAPPSRTLADVDAQAQARRLAKWEDVLRRLDGIDAAALSEDNRINLAVYRPQIEAMAENIRVRAYEMPFNSDSSFWSNLAFMARGDFGSVEDYEAYAARLRDVPRVFGQHIDNMRAGLARGFSVPRAVLEGRDGSIAAVADLDDPEAASFWAPYARMPATIPAGEQERLREEGRAAIREAVVPAFRTLLAFFREEYVPQARTTLAAEAMPDGERFYRAQIREYTTLDLSPQEIHGIGLAEVARIRGEMEAIIDGLGFEGDFQDFIAFLRTDPQFYPETPRDLLERAAWIAKRVDGRLGDFFEPLPRHRFTIEPVPDDIAPFWTAGRGGLGTYWVNTYDLPSRPYYNLPALTLHESAPGHSFQAALALEQGEQPDFRRNSYISAYGEGWALYVEKLGKEMGIYETPYEDFGRLTYEMWRACRLVIDTGVHHDGWSREQALAYLRDNTALSEHEVTTEVDRYISWPAQALSYKLGELAIVRLRGEAEAALGAEFDIKAFHDAVLRLGSVPLPVLEDRIRAFIREQKDAADGEIAAAA